MTSVRADAERLRGTLQSSSAQQFTMSEITTEGGLRLREFQSADGTVFAIVWSGPVMPDLQPLLGASFADYAAALRAQIHPGRHRALRLESPGLVVEAGGHLRGYTGRAYLPAAIPAGVPRAALR